MNQTILPFKLEKTDEKITPNAGLSIYAEMIEALGLRKKIQAYFPKPGSAKGFAAEVYLVSLVLQFLAGGKYLEDIRKIQNDEALRLIAGLGIVPTSDAIGDWLRNLSTEKRLALSKLHRYLTARFLKRFPRTKHILDIDATMIAAEKYSSQMTYKGETGYMPMVGYLDCGWCIGYEFREGNNAPADRNLDFIFQCLEMMPKEHTIEAIRIDSAGYQADIFNAIDQRGMKFTITGRHTEPMMKEIARIPEKGWARKPGTDREITEMMTCMAKTDYFRVVVERWINPRPDLFGQEPAYCYHMICTNYGMDQKTTEEIIAFHGQRATSENYHKEVKLGFHLEYVPCDDFGANDLWFALGLLAYNLHVMAKAYVLPKGWGRFTIGTIRWRLIQIAGKVVQHAHEIWLKISGITDELFDLIQEARQKCWGLSDS